MPVNKRRWEYKASGGGLHANGEIESLNVVDAMEELLVELRARLQPPWTVDSLTRIEIAEVREAK